MVVLSPSSDLRGGGTLKKRKLGSGKRRRRGKRRLDPVLLRVRRTRGELDGNAILGQEGGKEEGAVRRLRGCLQGERKASKGRRREAARCLNLPWDEQKVLLLIPEKGRGEGNMRAVGGSREREKQRGGKEPSLFCKI